MCHCASPLLHVSPVRAVSRLSGVPQVCLLTSFCSQFPAFQGLSSSCRHVPFTFFGVPMPLLWSFCTVSLMSWFTHPAPHALDLLSIYIRLFFSPSPLGLPAFGPQDRVLSALSSCAWCHIRVQHLGAAVAKKKSGLACRLWANSIFRGIFGHLDLQILGTLCWAYANEVLQRLVTRQKADCFFMGIAKGRQGSYLPNFKLWRMETEELLSKILGGPFFIFLFISFFIPPSRAKICFPSVLFP